MPRTYKKVLGPTRRLNYDEKYLYAAVNAVRKQQCNITQASEMYAVPYTTLHRALKAVEKDEPIKSLGGQTVLSEDEETMIVDGLITCSEWGFPLAKRDVVDVVRDYLNTMVITYFRVYFTFQFE